MVHPNDVVSANGPLVDGGQSREATPRTGSAVIVGPAGVGQILFYPVQRSFLRFQNRVPLDLRNCTVDGVSR